MTQINSDINFLGSLRSAGTVTPAQTGLIVGGGTYNITPGTSLFLRALWVGTSGDLVARFHDDSTFTTLTAVPVGLYPFVLDQIGTASTVGGLVGLC